MKSRGMYETPGGTILLAAHRAIESITLDRGAAHLKDELMPKYAELIYNGFWFAPERELLQTLIDKSQEFVAGRVRLKLYKGGVYVDRPRQPAFALRPGPRHLRGRRGRLRPATTRPASSSSMRCGCARWPSAARRSTRRPPSRSARRAVSDPRLRRAQGWHLLAWASKAMPMSGKKAEVIASWLDSSRHWVRQI